MTKQEELAYLFGIMSEASKWSPAPDDNRDFVRIEVEERIRNLIGGVDTEPGNLPAEDEALTNEDFKALEAAKLNEHLDNGRIPDPEKAKKAISEWKSKRVRCQENGHPVWHLRSECVKEPRDNRNGGPRWVWRWIGPPDKKKQEDQMWAEHENSGKED